MQKAHQARHHPSAALRQRAAAAAAAPTQHRVQTAAAVAAAVAMMLLVRPGQEAQVTRQALAHLKAITAAMDHWRPATMAVVAVVAPEQLAGRVPGPYQVAAALASTHPSLAFPRLMAAAAGLGVTQMLAAAAPAGEVLELPAPQLQPLAPQTPAAAAADQAGALRSQAPPVAPASLKFAM